MTAGAGDAVAARGRIGALWSFDGRHRVLHLTWFAFFLTFVVWFNMAPFVPTIAEQFSLSAEQIAVLALCNVALTVPARVLVGMLLDRFGPRRVYGCLLVFAAVPCTSFALADSFPVMVGSRLLLSLVGAGFVVGIRMVAEWFPPSEIGTAEGVYGGWGNFGSAAAALTLPTVAGLVGGPAGWRVAIGATGLIAAAYGLFYLRAVTDTPDGTTYRRPRRQGALEVTSPRAVVGLVAVMFPLTAVLGLVAWRLQRVGFLSARVTFAVWAAFLVVFALQARTAVRVNVPARRDAYPEHDRYPFRSVGLLGVAYFVTFGSELAVVSMLPAFFASTWGLSPVVAGATASAFAFMNLVARPAGGLLSDALGSRRRTLVFLVAGLAAGYTVLAFVGPSWPVAAAMVATSACSLFVQSGEGAVFAIVPLVKKRVTGQVAGIVGAYGNVGALTYLTILSIFGTRVFFACVAGSAVIAATILTRLDEPKDAFATELLDDAAGPEPEPAMAGR